MAELGADVRHNTSDCRYGNLGFWQVFSAIIDPPVVTDGFVYRFSAYHLPVIFRGALENVEFLTCEFPDWP